LIPAMQSNLLQAESDKHTLRSELKKAAAARGELEAETNALNGKLLEARDLMSKLKADSLKAQTEKQDLEGKLKGADTKRSAIEVQLREATTARSLLEDQMTQLTAELRAAQSQSGPKSIQPPASAPTYAGAGYPRSQKLSKEIERIETMLTNTMKLMDDPEMELSMVMRKRNECKELESYLRGIRFATETDSTGN
jgi:chromosome segregation ATPase